VLNSSNVVLQLFVLGRIVEGTAHIRTIMHSDHNRTNTRRQLNFSPVSAVATIISNVRAHISLSITVHGDIYARTTYCQLYARTVHDAIRLCPENSPIDLCYEKEDRNIKI
jgi:hypothetical protein